MIDGYKIDHTNLRERISGEKDEIVEEKQWGFAALSRGGQRGEPEFWKESRGITGLVEGKHGRVP
jgi:hypothetical protein